MSFFGIDEITFTVVWQPINFSIISIKRIPLKRVGKVEDVASLVNFLATEEANYITGQTLVVDGGLFMK